jgi:hypothetical protein
LVPISEPTQGLVHMGRTATRQHTASVAVAEPVSSVSSMVESNKSAQARLMAWYQGQTRSRPPRLKGTARSR